MPPLQQQRELWSCDVRTTLPATPPAPNQRFNSSFAVTPWHGFLWRSDGRGVNHDPEQPRQRRQDLEPAFLETGAIYAMNTAAFRRIGNRFCAPWSPVVVTHPGPEIDTPSDLALCRTIAAQEAE